MSIIIEHISFSHYKNAHAHAYAHTHTYMYADMYVKFYKTTYFFALKSVEFSAYNRVLVVKFKEKRF